MTAAPTLALPRFGRAEPALPGGRAALLAEVSLRLVRGDDPDRVVLPAVYDELESAGIIDGMVAFIASPTDEVLHLGTLRGFDESMARRCARLDFGEAICGLVARLREPMHVTDIQRSLDPRADLVRGEGVNAYASQPLLVGDRLVGTLSFASRSRRSFTSEQLTLFRDIARLIAAARERQSAGGSNAGRRAWLALEC